MQLATRVLEDGVVWRPRHDAHYVVASLLVSAREAPPVCILQSVLLAIEAHLRRGELPFGFGVLSGRPCFCPKTHRSYVLVEGAHECAPLGAAGGDHGALALALGDAIVALERAGRVIAGFYRGGATVEPRPATGDVGVLHSLCGDPWQLMLLRASGDTPPRGCIVRVEPIGARAYAAPFTELLPRRGRERDGRARSAVTWETYHASESVVPLPLPPPVAAATSDARRNRGGGGPATGGLLSRAAGALRRLTTTVPPSSRPGNAPVAAKVTAPVAAKVTAPVAAKVAAEVTGGAPLRRPLQAEERAPPHRAPEGEIVAPSRVPEPAIAMPAVAEPRAPAAPPLSSARATFPMLVPPSEESESARPVAQVRVAVAVVVLLGVAGAVLYLR